MVLSRTSFALLLIGSGCGAKMTNRVDLSTFQPTTKRVADELPLPLWHRYSPRSSTTGNWRCEEIDREMKLELFKYLIVKLSSKLGFFLPSDITIDGVYNPCAKALPAGKSGPPKPLVQVSLLQRV